MRRAGMTTRHPTPEAVTDPDQSNPYVSRGGIKLDHALNEFQFDPSGLDAADLGCSTGGFTDCLLQRGARSVICVDTAYGQLAWKLRTDPRVTVWERTNALHAEPPSAGVDLVVLDMGWTPQRLALPAARRWVNPTGRIITLIKPHYEQSNEERSARPPKQALSIEQGLAIVERVADQIRTIGFKIVDTTQSPILGGGNRSKRKSRGNPEWLALVIPDSDHGSGPVSS
ncbi:MAG TPA: TlyA family rRNA (cytidine-2'-O)-methyltransferase [Phycisphaerales bacterium]|nr:TlyA family rRNA (cytidine-2'-O)-methyltransferase [Phycisphaerales bacterium]